MNILTHVAFCKKPRSIKPNEVSSCFKLLVVCCNIRFAILSQWPVTYVPPCISFPRLSQGMGDIGRESHVSFLLCCTSYFRAANCSKIVFPSFSFSSSVTRMTERWRSSMTPVWKTHFYQPHIQLQRL